MTQRLGGFLLLLGVDWVCGCGAGCRIGAGPGFICVIFYLQIAITINSIKNRSTPSLCRKSLQGAAGIFAVKNDVF